MEFIAVIFFLILIILTINSSKSDSKRKNEAANYNNPTYESSFDKSLRLKRENDEREAKRIKEYAILQAAKEKVLNSHISYFEGSYRVYYLAPYYPVNRYSQSSLTSEELRTREKLFNFKDGRNSREILTDFTHLINEKIKTSNNIICIIPASNPSKSRLRYESFIKQLSLATGIDNGYEAIINYHNLEAGHLTGANNNADKFYINQDKIKGKNVILIDDVITRGRSFITIASKLKSLGANNISGLFVCKTQYK